MNDYTYIGNSDVNAIEELYNSYKKDPNSVDAGYARFFEGFDFAQTSFEDGGGVPENFQKEFKVINLINGYRNRGHLFTKTNPVRERRKYKPTLALENFGLEESDLDIVFQAGEEIGLGPLPLREIIKDLEDHYCESIGLEYMYMENPAKIAWFKQAMEINNRPQFDKERKIDIFTTLNKASTFESFLGKKFVGQKRFSVEGLDALIPAMEALIQKGSDIGVDYFVVGMAHRGRLNVLANIFEFSEVIAFYPACIYKHICSGDSC